MRKLRNNIKRYLLKPGRFIYLSKYFNKKDSFKVLDIGCGSDSYALTKRNFPYCNYYGLDKGAWHSNDEDYDEIENFIHADLDAPGWSSSIDLKFDLIIMSHVVEHLKDYKEAICEASELLDDNGLLYIETPSPQTINFPKADGFLNFYDDPTHTKIVFPNDLIKILQSQSLIVLKSVRRRLISRILSVGLVAVFLNIFWYLPIQKKLKSPGLWDIYGVPWVTIAQNKK